MYKQHYYHKTRKQRDRDFIEEGREIETKEEGGEMNNETVGNSCLFYLLLSLLFIMNI
jgi:hypothetical protein